MADEKKTVAAAEVKAPEKAAEKKNAVDETLDSAMQSAGSAASPEEDASAQENNPPPETEMALMEFLFGNGPDGRLADCLESYAPDALFAHCLTRSFVHAYIAETRGEIDAFANLGKKIPEAEMARLEMVFLSKERAALSELAPLQILADFLRRLWSDAVRRRLGELPMHGDEELERRRIRLSVIARRFKGTPWKVATSLMDSSLLA